jgi:chromosome segregation ATPase
LVHWQQELEHRARNKYGAFDQMSAELRRLREQCDAFVALAEALRTSDGWLSYRVEVLRDQLLELEGQAAAHPSTLERICTALIDRDEALQQARGELERMCTLATNWEAEVGTVGATIGSSAHGSWRRRPSRARLRRGHGRPSRRPRRPTS